MRLAGRAAAAVLVAGGMAASCAGHHPAPAGLPERLRQARTLTAELRVSVSGPTLRGRARVLAGFRRPDAMRIELPGPTGVRLIAVADGGTLTAVFPGERAVFQGPADAAALEAIVGVALTPGEMMDVLLGTPSPRLQSFEADWGPQGPRRVDARLPDGTRLRVQIEGAETDAEIPAAAFVAPAHEGYRMVDADEARSLWGGR